MKTRLTNTLAVIFLWTVCSPLFSFTSGKDIKENKAKTNFIKDTTLHFFGVISGVKKAEDGEELIIRLFEMEGKEKTASVNLPVTVKSARRLNPIEFPLPNTATSTAPWKSVTVTLNPHETITQGILPVR